MGTLSIHSLDPAIEARVREKARRERISLNQALKALLAEAVGIRPTADPTDHRADFAPLAGIWTEQDATDFNAATADLATIDPRDWQ